MMVWKIIFLSKWVYSQVPCESSWVWNFWEVVFCHNSNSFGFFWAIVKVSGQNCFQTLSGSLGQIHLGLPKGSAEGSTKVHWGSFTKIPHFSLKWLLFQKRFFGGFRHLSPSLVLGSKLHELLICLSHTTPICRQQTERSYRCVSWGYSGILWVYFWKC